MVTAYRAGTLEARIVRSLIQVNSVILANLVIGENVVPEFIQQDCTPEKLVPALSEILADSDQRRRQLAAFAKLDDIMSTGNQPPSVRAADIVLATVAKIPGSELKHLPPLTSGAARPHPTSAGSNYLRLPMAT